MKNDISINNTERMMKHGTYQVKCKKIYDSFEKKKQFRQLGRNLV